MPKYLLDSGILSAYVHRRERVYDRVVQQRRAGQRVGTGPPVIGEFVAGIERSASRERNLSKFRLPLPTLKVWPFEQDDALEYGRLLAELLRLGRPMQQIDMQIAPHRAPARRLHGRHHR
jgi:tRNA(fMet)-specific endonuclease VapC